MAVLSDFNDLQVLQAQSAFRQTFCLPKGSRPFCPARSPEAPNPEALRAAGREGRRDPEIVKKFKFQDTIISLNQKAKSSSGVWRKTDARRSPGQTVRDRPIGIAGRVGEIPATLDRESEDWLSQKDGFTRSPSPRRKPSDYGDTRNPPPMLALSVCLCYRDAQPRRQKLADRIAIKKLTASDCTLFEAVFRKIGAGNQKTVLTWDNFTADHIDPHSKGGQTKLGSAALMCREHNSAKGNRRGGNRTSFCSGEKRQNFAKREC